MMNPKETQPGKMSPAEKARQLAQEAAAKREQEAQAKKEQQAERYGNLQEQLVEAGEVLASKRKELSEVQEGLDEIAAIEQGSPLSSELVELRAQLEESKKTLTSEVEEASRVVQSTEADPLFAEFAAAELAEKAEAARVQAEAEEAQRKQEQRDKYKRIFESLDETIREITRAIRVAESREQDIVELREDKKKLEKERDELAKGIEGDVAGLLSALPEPVRVKIDLRVYEAQKGGKRIDGSSGQAQNGRMEYRPAGTTVPEWFAAWRENVTPSFLPFLDKPLRALRDFEGDPRLGEMRGIVERLQELSDKENALFADRKDTNNLFMKRLLGPNSGLMTLNRVDWEMLRHSEGVDQQALQGKLQSLRNFKEKSPLLTADVDDELSKKYNAQGGSGLFSPIGANIA